LGPGVSLPDPATDHIAARAEHAWEDGDSFNYRNRRQRPNPPWDYPLRAQVHVTSPNCQALGCKASDIEHMRVLTFLLTTAGLACTSSLAEKLAPPGTGRSHQRWRKSSAR